MPRTLPVWSFPRGYDPNLMGDACELCRRVDDWISRPAPPGQDWVAWSCRCCTRLTEIPLE